MSGNEALNAELRNSPRGLDARPCAALRFTMLSVAENAPVPVSTTMIYLARPKRGSSGDCKLSPWDVTATLIIG